MNSKLSFITLFVSFSMSVFACVPDSSNVSSTVRQQKSAVFEEINHFMLVPFIFEKLGPAMRDTGDQERHIFEWKVDDGRIFYVITGNGCGKPHEVGFR